jgi:hypothetical protein
LAEGLEGQGELREKHVNGSNPGRGASRRSIRRSGALTCLLVGLLAAAWALPAAASAIELRPLVESFGPDGSSGTSFERPTALAFDQGKKRLYALDAETHNIHAFEVPTSGTHTPLGGSFPLNVPVGEVNGIAANGSSHDFYYATPEENKLFGFSESGTTLTGFPIAGHNYSCGTAVDSSGNVWVSQGNEEFVKKYSPAGALLETITVGLFPCHLAFDSEDNLYVGYYFGPTVKYTAASGYASSSTIDPEFTSAMTVDKATGEVFVVHFNYIQVWDSSGAFLYELKGEGFGGEFGGIAIDEAGEELYVADYGNHKVQVYGAPLKLPQVATEAAGAITVTTATFHGKVNPQGTALTDCHFEFVPHSQFVEDEYASVIAAQEAPCVPAAASIPADSSDHVVSADAGGLKFATTYHVRLVATNAVGEKQAASRIFTAAPEVPLVKGQAVEAVGTSEATVSAQINPQGGATTYHVEYGTTNAYGQSTAESAPFGFPTDNSFRTVSVHLGGLAPGTAYHFRFVAESSAGVSEGADTSFATYPVPSGFSPCANDRFRTGAGGRLPDCRAYEQASPIDKHGSNAQGKAGLVTTSPAGDRVTFFANGGLPTTGGSSSLSPFMASRDPSGWSTDGLVPSSDPGDVMKLAGFSEGLSTAVSIGRPPGGTGGKALFLRDTATATFQIGLTEPTDFAPEVVGFAGDSADLIFTSRAQLLPGALAGKPNLYELDHGTLSLASRVPPGAATTCDDESGPACVAPAEGTTYNSGGHKISRDGRVFFTADPTQEGFRSGRIYMRKDGRTAWISASQRTTPDPGGEKPAELVGVTPDGSKAFFLSCEKLTDDSTAHSTGASSCTTSSSPPVIQGQDLYSYDVETGELTDLTVDSNPGDPLGAAVQQVRGISEDGSYVYFTANGALDGALPGQCSPAGFNGDCSLYVYHGGVTKLIARINNIDVTFGQSRIAADGSAFLFDTNLSLTGYDNTSASCKAKVNGPCKEFFRYSAPSETLTCVSCMPTNTSPTGPANLGTRQDFLQDGPASPSPSRNLSADGNRAFFESPDALVPGDTNGLVDIYEWEAKGTGSCISESQNGGCLYLLSGGTEPSQFLDASKNGDHVFLFTVQQLVPTDKDQLFDVYDVGVGAGLAAQHTLAPPTCSTTACQANPAPPPDPSTASAVFSGPGNARQKPAARRCRKGKRKVRQAGKVRCKAHKQHKRHNNRGGAK